MQPRSNFQLESAFISARHLQTLQLHVKVRTPCPVDKRFDGKFFLSFSFLKKERASEIVLTALTAAADDTWKRMESRT